MSTFGDAVRKALADRGLSQRAAARAVHYDIAYLSRVLAGKQRPSAEFVEALGSLLGLELAPLLAEDTSDGAARDGQDTLVSDAVGYLLEHDNRHGGDHVADAAVQVWRAQTDQLVGADKRRLAAVAEIGEVAGWLLHDAARYEEARTALTESHMLARLAGDEPLEWFILDLIAMVDVHTGRAGEALAIADELITGRGVPGRVALMARARQARGLAQAGDRARTIAALDRAAGGLQESVHSDDPSFTWWVDSAEIELHRGEAMLSLGDPAAALPHLQRSSAASTDGGRRAFGNILAELHAYVLLAAWREAEAPLLRLEPILRTVTSSRTRQRLRRTLRIIERDGPTWLADTAHDVASPRA
ncbi:helix-turn-helix transcriptional regulator [Streptomyces sp. NPDC047002]|uniref:helix-turn-helix domain-containing protein n=1 Tax=Streptomyces sp. NPDC047002 TaxID=3155475 RepID=UPI003452A4A1